jgi:hypothetical protein
MLSWVTLSCSSGFLAEVTTATSIPKGKDEMRWNGPGPLGRASWVLIRRLLYFDNFHFLLIYRKNIPSARIMCRVVQPHISCKEKHRDALTVERKL